MKDPYFVNLEKANEAGKNVFRVGSWLNLTQEEMTVWLVGFSIADPNQDHSACMAFAWGFLQAYTERKPQ